MEMGSIFVVTVVTHMYIFTKAHWIVQLKWMYFMVCKLYINKGDFFKKPRYQKYHFSMLQSENRSDILHNQPQFSPLLLIC